jgi:toxin ParE1/3/4
MARVLKRVAAKRDLTDHFVFLGENASVDVARRFLDAANVSFHALAKMRELGAPKELSESALVCGACLAREGFRAFSHRSIGRTVTLVGTSLVKT